MNFNIFAFFGEHLWLLLYYIVICLVAFIVFGVDKKKAKEKAWRTPEKTLLTLCAVGGAVGGFLGMQIFRHKTKHWYFVVLVPLFIILHAVLIFALMNLSLIFA